MNPVLQVGGLAKSFDGVRAVRAMDLCVHPGEVYGLVGPDGAGKTTAMRMLAGLVKPDGGSVLVDGLNLKTSLQSAHERMGYMPQQYSLYGDLSVIENLRFFAGMYGVPRHMRLEREKRLLGISRLDEFKDRPAAALSGGMYKKLALSCALIHEPKLLLLDEPTNGVDPISRRELWAFLDELVGGGIAVVVSTPYMDEAQRCHRVGLLIDGAVATEGTPKELREGFEENVLELLVSDAHLAREELAKTPDVGSVYSMGRRLHVTFDAEKGREERIRTLLESAGIGLTSMIRVEPSFEDIFMFHTSRSTKAADHAG